MKRIMLACLIMFSMLLAQAQQQKGAGAAQNPEAQLKRRVDKMTEQYSLNDQQKTQVSDLLKTTMAQVQEIRNKYPGDRRAAAPEMKAVRQKYHEQLKGILTPEQFAKWEADAKARHEKMKARRAQGAGKPGKKPADPPTEGPLDFDVLGD